MSQEWREQVEDLHAAMLRRTDHEALEGERKLVEYVATNVARRLCQRALRANPSEDFMACAVPVLMRALLEERIDIVARASIRIAALERELQQFRNQTARQAQLIDVLCNPSHGKGS